MKDSLLLDRQKEGLSFLSFLGLIEDRGERAAVILFASQWKVRNIALTPFPSIYWGCGTTRNMTFTNCHHE